LIHSLIKTAPSSKHNLCPLPCQSLLEPNPKVAFPQGCHESNTDSWDCDEEILDWVIDRSRHDRRGTGYRLLSLFTPSALRRVVTGRAAGAYRSLTKLCGRRLSESNGYAFSDRGCNPIVDSDRQLPCRKGHAPAGTGDSY